MKTFEDLAGFTDSLYSMGDVLISSNEIGTDKVLNSVNKLLSSIVSKMIETQLGEDAGTGIEIMRNIIDS